MVESWLRRVGTEVLAPGPQTGRGAWAGSMVSRPSRYKFVANSPWFSTLKLDKSSDSWRGLPEFPGQSDRNERNQSLLNVKPPAIQVDQHEVIGICWAHRVRSLGTILVLVSNGNGKPPIGRWYTSCEFPAFFCYWQHQKIYWNMFKINMEHILILRMFCCQIRLISISRHSVCTHQNRRKFQQMMVEVIGNDNAEKIQILPATIARTDRNCPEYHDNYEDENTFYAGSGLELLWGSRRTWSIVTIAMFCHVAGFGPGGNSLNVEQQHLSSSFCG